MTQVVPIDQVKPSTYNPRTADPARLDVVELSLRKLGWLLPIYATPEGEILSGHQRHLVARRMELPTVPVAYTEPMELEERKAVNIAFNRGTNDVGSKDTPHSMTEALQCLDLAGMAAKLSDIPAQSPLFMRCVQAEQVGVRDLTRANRGRWQNYSRNLARALAGKGIVQPVVCTRDLRVINGLGRVQHLAEKKVAKASVIFIRHKEARFAEAVLNLLSMDFNIHTRYADLLRYNSFRRARRVRDYLGRGFVVFCQGRKPAKAFDILKAGHRRRWVSLHGRAVLDFGAGHLTETRILRRAGIECTPFEPYRLNAETSEIDKAESLQLTREFLAEVGGGRQWTSVFISSVLNSVPFAGDRQYIVTIVQALCVEQGAVYAAASSVNQTGWKSTRGANYMNKTNDENLQFILDYEPGIGIAELTGKPKVQKYHNVAEFRELFLHGFRDVKAGYETTNVYAIATGARRINRTQLRAAIRFEFDLPYPDGSRMGMVDEAMKAFSKRLGVKL